VKNGLKKTGDGHHVNGAVRLINFLTILLIYIYQIVKGIFKIETEATRHKALFHRQAWHNVNKLRGSIEYDA
jgi:hypothetical protein